MLYSVIVSVDAPPGEHPKVRRSLKKALSAGYAESEYQYLAEGDREHPFYRATEWKGSGLLTRSQFAALLEDLGNPGAEDVETLGSLGGPLGLGVVSDISFRDDSPDWILCLRVTPVPRYGKEVRGETDEEKAADAERIWERLRGAMLRFYESGWDRNRVTYGPKYAAAVKREMKELRYFFG